MTAIGCRAHLPLNYCIGALIAHRDGESWIVDVLGAPSVEKRSEKELITSSLIALLN